MSERILVVDDELNIGRSFEIILGGEGFDVETATSSEEGLKKAAAERFCAVFLDIQLPGMDGLEALRILRDKQPDLPVVMISGHATIERAVEATRQGAFEFIEKPFSRERIVLTARNATESGRLKREIELLRDGDSEILGDSEGIRSLREEMRRVAPTDTRVLILGESGTGKELVARSLHRSGPRANQSFIRVNCAAIPEELIEAELFGAVKGAYTGADTARGGLFAAANGGTLFLDEIGDMSLKAQAKVLRVLQEGEYEAVGSTKTLTVDVRVLAATHKDLAAQVRNGEFREDLLFRLNVIPLTVPPLRERGDDIRLLGTNFLGKYAARHERPTPRVHADAWLKMQAYPWPGNVRELMNVMERLLILGRGDVLGLSDLPAEIAGRTDPVIPAVSTTTLHPYAGLPLKAAREACERDLIAAALERHEGNVTRAANELGIERTNLHKRIKSLGVNEE